MEGFFDLNFVLFEEESEKMCEKERVTSIALTDQEILDITMSCQGNIKLLKMACSIQPVKTVIYIEKC